MTAKEYCQSVEWDATGELISMLQDFATLKCKEQRENCAREIGRKIHTHIKATKELCKIVVINAKQPEV